MPKTSEESRKERHSAHRVRRDPVLENAVDLARAAAEDVALHFGVGDYLGYYPVGERVLTHYFTVEHPGYVGWHWAVTVSRVPRGRQAKVCEVDMLPGKGALLAPAWVPWADRLLPGDVSRRDILPYRKDDERLEPGLEDTSENPDLPLVRDLGLGRARVLSKEGRDQAIKRWYDSERGPGHVRRPQATCSSCGFLIKMPGSYRRLFGVCANEWAQDDGRVVSLDHSCGAHSETDIPKQKSEWEVKPKRVDDFQVEVSAHVEGCDTL